MSTKDISPYSPSLNDDEFDLKTYSGECTLIDLTKDEIQRLLLREDDPTSEDCSVVEDDPTVSKMESVPDEDEDYTDSDVVEVGDYDFDEDDDDDDDDGW